MNFKIVRNVAGLYLLAVILLGHNQVGVKADGCYENCTPSTGICIWFDCTASCGTEALICEDWCSPNPIDTGDLSYFMCSPDNPPTTNDGYCNCNGGGPLGEG